METMNGMEMFRKFRPMVERQAWKVSRNYGLKIEEIRSQAYLVFCEALKKYNPERASFSTFLYNRLRTVNDYALRLKRQNNEIVHIESMDFQDVRLSDFESVMGKLETASELFEEAQEIVYWLIAREWEVPGINYRPTLSMARRYFRNRNWRIRRIENAWLEIGKWWNKKEGMKCW